MPIELAIPDPRYRGDGVWEAEVAPEDVDVLGSPRERLGEVTVLLLPDLISPDPDAHVLRFAPQQGRLLNRGRTSRAIVIYGREGAPVEQEAPHRFGPRVQHDDERFLAELDKLRDTNPGLIRAGAELLARVRQEFGGYLQVSGSGRYINREDNFWTVKVQPRDGSLAITVRGVPRSFPDLPDLEIKPDRSSYSRFKIESEAQFESAWRVIRQAGKS